MPTWQARIVDFGMRAVVRRRDWGRGRGGRGFMEGAVWELQQIDGQWHIAGPSYSGSRNDRSRARA